MQKFVIWLMALVLLIPALQATAAEAAASQVEVNMTIGQPSVTVNGEPLTVKAPVVSNGTTLVPLRVITSAFDAELAWIAETQGIVLTYGGKTIELQIGKTEAAVNGVIQAISGAPQLMDETTMVPVRFISETFGADVTFTEETQQIRITGQGAASVPAEQSEPTIDQDAGKTKIGDSHWGWSMNYPTGLVQQFQAPAGDFVVFGDANGQYEITVFIDPELTDVKTSGLMEELYEYVYGMVLDEQMVEANGQTYAQVIWKTEEDAYTMDRAYLQDGRVYFVTLTILNEADYRNGTKRAVYQGLLNSFETSFDAANSALKDVSLISGGLMLHRSKDYGITMQVPSKWTAESEDGLRFYSPQDSLSTYFTMSSLKPGDTLERWVERHESRFKQEFTEKYRKITAFPIRTVSGEPAVVKRWEFSYGDGSEWREYLDVYVIKGGYKYNFTFDYPSEKRSGLQKTLNEVIESIEIDAKLARETFGQLPDTYDIDLWATEKLVNKTYGYSISVPVYWSESYMHDGSEYVAYEFKGTTFDVSVMEDMTLEEAKAMYVEITKGMAERDESVVLLENKRTTVDGRNAWKYVVAQDDFEGDRKQTTTVHVEKEGKLYSITYSIYEATATPENMERLEAAAASFRFQ